MMQDPPFGTYIVIAHICTKRSGGCVKYDIVIILKALDPVALLELKMKLK